MLGLLVYHATLFWQLWLYQGVEAWTLAEFLLLLMGPIMLLVGASLLVPAGAVPDYRSYFESVRVPFYSVGFLIQLQPIPLPYLLFDLSHFQPLLLGNLVFASAFGVGLVARNRSVDKVLVCFWILGIAGSMVVNNDHDAARVLIESRRG